MAKDKPIDPDKAARKAEKKAKKEAAAAAAGGSTTEAGVHKSSSSSKKDKAAKAKAIEAELENVDVTQKLLDTLDESAPGSVVTTAQEGGSGGKKKLDVRVKREIVVGALVPFANPLADEKVGKKVLKVVMKSNKAKTLKRGVKEVVKAVRKSPTTSSGPEPFAVVVLAADISPMDVISHIPVLCEDHQIPYIFVPSRVELGAASMTKRPTSVVMIGRDKSGKGREKSGGKENAQEKDGDVMDVVEDWSEVYGELVKAVVKAGKGVRI